MPPTTEGIGEAARIIRAGGLVAFPTETVYGLGADATNARAVADLYAAKGRPSFNPLISHLPDATTAARHGVFDEKATALAAAFWPGALTLVLPRAAGAGEGQVCDLATSGLDSIALRVPAHPIATALLRQAGCPVVAPSANRSGHVSPTEAAHVLADLDGRIDAVIDGGATPVGVESTIVSVLGGGLVLLRPGGIARQALERATGQAFADGTASGEAGSGDGNTTPRPLSPGLLASHYAPNAGVRLQARHVADNEALLTFGGFRPEGSDKAAAIIDLSPSADLAEAAAALFGALRRLDAMPGISGIAVAPIPERDLGEAINDRLRRAAAPR